MPLSSSSQPRIAESEFVTKPQLLDEISRLKRQSSGPYISTEFDNIISYINHEMSHPSKLLATALSDYYVKLRCYTHADEIELDQLLSRLKSI